MEDIKSRSDMQLSAMHNIKELTRPKVVDPITFKPLMKRWLKEIRAPAPRPPSEPHESDFKFAEFAQLDQAFMTHFPLRESELEKFPNLLPTKKTTFKPPTMRFGWLLRADELKELAIAKNQYVAHVSRQWYKPDDPNRPEGAEFNAAVDMYLFQSEPVYAAMQTTDALLELGRIECGLNKKYPGWGLDYFSGNDIWNGVEEDPEDTVFVNIYTNIDLCKQDPERRKKGPVPTHEDIKKMREWLGLGEDREPGWWFSLTDLTKITWDRYKWQLIQDEM